MLIPVLIPPSMPPKSWKNSTLARSLATGRGLGVPSLLLCLFASAACNGTIDKQEDKSGLRPSVTGGPSASNTPTGGGATETNATGPASATDGEGSTDNVRGIDDTSSSGSRRGSSSGRARAPRVDDDAGVDDAGVEVDAGVVDAGVADAGAVDAGVDAGAAP